MDQKSHKKKIVFFIPEFPVITETFIQRDIAKLIELGNLDITILCLKKGTGDLDELLKPRTHKIRLNPIDLLFSLKYLLLSHTLVQSFIK